MSPRATEIPSIRPLLERRLREQLMADHPDKTPEEIETFARELMDCAERAGERLRDAHR